MSVCLPNHTTTVCVCVSARVFVCLCVNYYTKYTTKKIQITELSLYMFSGNMNTIKLLRPLPHKVYTAKFNLLETTPNTYKHIFRLTLVPNNKNYIYLLLFH